MSIRALGRQFVAQVKNRNQRYWTGTERHPQGALFIPHGGKPPPIFDRPTVEAGRRRMAGENNPAAPWREPHWSDKLAIPAPGARTAKQLRLFDDE
jgi:hypothetical protein